MGVDVARRSTLPGHESGEHGRLNAGLIAFAAAIGAVGPAVTALGYGPITPAAETRPAALLTVLVVAGGTAAWLSGTSRPRPMVSVPLLVILGSLATWPTLGRVQGAWCVLATAAAVAILRTLGAVPRRITALVFVGVGVAGTVDAGWLWARTDSGLLAVSVLGLSVTVGTVMPRSGSVTSAGDRWFRGIRVALEVRWPPVRAAVLRARDRIVRNRILVAATSVVGIAAAVGFYQMTHVPSFTIFEGLRPTDLAVHMGLVANLRWDSVPPETLPPHPVFHLLTYGLGALVDQRTAATIVAAFGVAMTVPASVVVSRLPALRSPRAGTGLLTGVSAALLYLLFESPVLLAAPTDVLAGQVPFTQVHVWGSPTFVVAVPLNILIAGFLAQAVRGGDARVERRCWTLIPLLAVAATLAKPSFTPVLLISVPLACALLRPANPMRLLRNFGLRYVLPVVMTVGLQALLLSSHDVGIVVRPFQTFSQLGLTDFHPLLQFSPALAVIACILVWRRDFLMNPAIVLVGSSLLIGVAAFVLLAFDGGPPSSGDTAQLAHSSYTLLMFFTILFAVQRLRDAAVNPPLGAVRTAGLSVLVLVLFLGLMAGSAAWAYLLRIWVPTPL